MELPETSHIFGHISVISLYVLSAISARLTDGAHVTLSFDIFQVRSLHLESSSKIVEINEFGERI